MQPDTTVQPDDSDVRFGHDWADVQDENGVDLSLLRYNLQHSVEERLLALESYVRFIEAVQPAARGTGIASISWWSGVWRSSRTALP